VTLPYIEALAGKGFAQAISEDEGLRQGVTTYQGYLTSLPVAQGLNRDYTDINDLV
ncbi:TPA: alanine dehydrogenase, partial [Streptococcus pneumoniae]|nr:alanine dehydrogenase [Streptococcus pneumoniae]